MNRGIRVLQTRALPLGYGAVFKLGNGERKTFPLSVFRICRKEKRKPEIRRKTGTISVPVNGADYGARTRHLHLGKVALYQMS